VGALRLGCRFVVPIPELEVFVESFRLGEHGAHSGRRPLGDWARGELHGRHCGGSHAAGLYPARFERRLPHTSAYATLPYPTHGGAAPFARGSRHRIMTRVIVPEHMDRPAAPCHTWRHARSRTSIRRRGASRPTRPAVPRAAHQGHRPRRSYGKPG
jgi:hypothetical protein